MACKAFKITKIMVIIVLSISRHPITIFQGLPWAMDGRDMRWYLGSLDNRLSIKWNIIVGHKGLILNCRTGLVCQQKKLLKRQFAGGSKDPRDPSLAGTEVEGGSCRPRLKFQHFCLPSFKIDVGFKKVFPFPSTRGTYTICCQNPGIQILRQKCVNDHFYTVNCYFWKLWKALFAGGGEAHYHCGFCRLILGLLASSLWKTIA